jgi:hypothetical protein
MARLLFTLSISLLILILVFGISETRAVEQLKKISLAVEGMD